MGTEKTPATTRLRAAAIFAMAVFLPTTMLHGCTAKAKQIVFEGSFRTPVEPQAVPGEIFVKYKDGTMKSEQEISKTYHLQILARFFSLGIQLVKVASGETVKDVIARLNRDPEVEAAESNYKVYAFKEPNDPQWEDLWGMQKVQMPLAWNRSTGSEKVVIAVLDTGIDYEHRDLAANMWKNPGEILNGIDDDENGIIDDVYGANFCNGSTTGDPRDDNGHGTHVAGTIAAVGNNQRDVAGMVWKAQLMAVKFLCRDGTGTTADAIRAIEYASSMGAHILNNSWGGAGSALALELAIREADRQGVLFVAAAGNETMNNDLAPTYPASYNVPNILTVAATDSRDRLAAFSSWGQESVHIGAPGVSILSTVPSDHLASASGTSMATAHVAGCAGLLKSRSFFLQARDLRDILLMAADRLPDLQRHVMGGRRLNCGDALLARSQPP